MRSFTKKGYIKHKKSNDEKVIEKWLSDGWIEVGVKEKPKTKKTKK